MVTCARARLRALPPRAEFLYDPDHPATSWLLWGHPPSTPYSPYAGASAATTVAGATVSPLPTDSPDPPDPADQTNAPPNCTGWSKAANAVVGSSNAIRGILHHAVSFGYPGAASHTIDDEKPSLDGDTLYVCQYEMPLAEGSSESLSLGYAFGGVSSMHGVVNECEAPQLGMELARVLDVDPTRPSAHLDHHQPPTMSDIWPDAYGDDSTAPPFALDPNPQFPPLRDDDLILGASNSNHKEDDAKSQSHQDMSCFPPDGQQRTTAIAHDVSQKVSESVALVPESDPEPVTHPRDLTPSIQEETSHPPVMADDSVSVRDISMPSALCVQQEIPPGRRFAAMLLHNLVYIISVLRIGRNIVMIDIYHVSYDPLAVDIEGRHCNNSIHIMYDPFGMMFGCLSGSTQCISETLTFLEEVCTLCNVPKLQCSCQSDQIVCANCTSFADLSSRLRSGSTWRYSRMACERVSLRRSAEEGQQIRRVRTSIWLESLDGWSSHPRTAEMRRRFFNFNGMLVSSPLLPQPSQQQQLAAGIGSGLGRPLGLPAGAASTTEEVVVAGVSRSNGAASGGAETPGTWFGCPMCPKLFRRKAGLQRHKRTVHGPRRHECDACGAKFQQGAHLKTHKVLVHAKSLDYSCELCRMRFPLRSRLTAHLRTKHGIDRTQES